MIVKIQLPLAGPAKDQGHALVYDESREFQTFLRVTEELLDVMDGDTRAFFEVDVGPVGTEEEFAVRRRLEEQGW